MVNAYVPHHAIVRDIKDETYNTNTYFLEFTDKKLQKDFSCIPGQFMMLSIVGVGEVAISLSDVSNNGFVTTTIRNVGSVTNAIMSLKKGDYIGMRGPYGTGWPLDSLNGKNVLIVAGGMGVAPLRGAINSINNSRKNFEHLEIIYGARTPDDMIFKYEFDKWKKIKNSMLHLTADTVSVETPFVCRTGLVTSCFPMMKTNHRNAVAFLCGPELMMRYAAKCLETIGFHDEQIYLSLERRMKCGIGKCGHCQIGLKYVCKDGPVFNYADVKPFIRPL
ncbi:MAG: FAD/NAD(P)-binding protein [Methanobacteriota archaeon]